MTKKKKKIISIIEDIGKGVLLEEDKEKEKPEDKEEKKEE